MPYLMPRPMTRRDSRLPQFQQRIPRDLIELAPGRRIAIRLPKGEAGGEAEVVNVIVGASAVRFSLRTAEPSLLKLRHAAALEQVERLWSALRSGPLTLSLRQRVGFAGLIYTAWRDALKEDAGFSQEEWQSIAETIQWELEEGGAGAMIAIPLEGGQHIKDATRNALERRFGRMTDFFLAREGLLITPESRLLLLHDVARAMMEQAEQAAREAGGDFRPDVNALRFPSWQPPKVAARPAAVSERPTYESLYEAYEKHPGKFGLRREATKREFRKTFVEDFAAFIRARSGHDNPALVTRGDVVAWRDKLLADGLSAKTVKDKKIAAVNAVYGRAANDGVLPMNPVGKIDLRPGKPQRERESGFTDAEAKAILEASDDFKPGRHAPEMAAAIRWVPWIGAYTGARITEITQLRGEDVFQEPDGWIIRFTPAAGGIKTGQYRDVPIHRRLIERGFLDFVAASGKGPLFYKPEKPGQISRSKAATVSGRISEWVRKGVGIADKRVQPTHGWRHRFKTLARRVGMDGEARDYIQGHAIKGMGSVYGDMAGLGREIAKLP